MTFTSFQNPTIILKTWPSLHALLGLVLPFSQCLDQTRGGPWVWRSLCQHSLDNFIPVRETREKKSMIISISKNACPGQQVAVPWPWPDAPVLLQALRKSVMPWEDKESHKIVLHIPLYSGKINSQGKKFTWHQWILNGLKEIMLWLWLGWCYCHDNCLHDLWCCNISQHRERQSYGDSILGCKGKSSSYKKRRILMDLSQGQDKCIERNMEVDR